MKSHPFIEENINISPGNKTIKAQNKVQKIPLIRKNPNDKNDVIIDLSSNKKGKKEEDENSTNSAEFSGNILKEEKNQKKIWKTTREKSPMVLSPKAYERYNQRMKEKKEKNKDIIDSFSEEKAIKSIQISPIVIPLSKNETPKKKIKRKRIGKFGIKKKKKW